MPQRVFKKVCNNPSRDRQGAVVEPETGPLPDGHVSEKRLREQKTMGSRRITGITPPIFNVCGAPILLARSEHGVGVKPRKL